MAALQALYPEGGMTWEKAYGVFSAFPGCRHRQLRHRARCVPAFPAECESLVCASAASYYQLAFIQ